MGFLARDALAVDQGAGRHHRIGAENRDRPDVAALTHGRARPHDGPDHLGVGRHMAAVHEHRVTDECACDHDTAASEYAAFHPGAGFDDTIGEDHRGTHDLALHLPLAFEQHTIPPISQAWGHHRASLAVDVVEVRLE